MKLYSVTCQTVEKTKRGELHRQSPTFILNGNTFGIVNERDAESIARRIVNPTGNPNLTVNATAVLWSEK